MKTLPSLGIAAAISSLVGCYTHPPPVDGGPRDAQIADAPTIADDAPPPIDAPVDAFVPECTVDGDCDAGPCSDARCEAGECVGTPLADGAACDDGDVCTRGDTCTAGTCGGERASCAVCDRTGGATLTTFAAEWMKRPHAGVALPGSSGYAITGFADGDLWLATVDSDLAVVIDRGLGDAAMGDSGYAIARARNGTGELLLGGYSQVGGGPALAWIARVDALGEEVGSRALFTDRNGSVHGLLPQPDGTSLFLANAGGRATFARLGTDGATISSEQSYFDVGWAYGLADLVPLVGGDHVLAGDVGAFPDRGARVIRVTETGDVVWDVPLDVAGAHALLALPDGGVIVAGQTDPTATTGSAWARRLDSAGGTVWDRTYGTDLNASISSIAATSDGFLFTSGTADDAWVIRTGEDGVLVEEARLALGGYESATLALEATGAIVIAGTSGPLVPPTEGATHAWILRATSLADLACPAD